MHLQDYNSVGFKSRPRADHFKKHHGRPFKGTLGTALRFLKKLCLYLITGFYLITYLFPPAKVPNELIVSICLSISNIYHITWVLAGRQYMFVEYMFVDKDPHEAYAFSFILKPEFGDIKKEHNEDIIILLNELTISL